MPRKRGKEKEIAAAHLRRSDRLLPRVQTPFSPYNRARLRRWWLYLRLWLNVAHDNPERKKRR